MADSHDKDPPEAGPAKKQLSGILYVAFVLFCVVIPVAAILYLAFPFCAFAGSGWDVHADLLGVSVVTAPALPPCILSLVVAIVVKVGANRHEMRLRTAWLLLPIVAFLEVVFLLGACCIKVIL